MSNEFTIEHIGVLEGHGGAVTSLVCGENKDGSPLYSQVPETNLLLDGN